jgi:hypothetical protein
MLTARLKLSLLLLLLLLFYPTTTPTRAALMDDPFVIGVEKTPASLV